MEKQSALTKIIGNKVEFTLEQLRNIFGRQTSKIHTSQKKFYDVILQQQSDIHFTLRLALNHQQLFEEIEYISEYMRRPILQTNDLFKYVIDDVEVLCEIGKRDWYDKLYIDIDKFHSPPARIFQTISFFNLTSLEIKLDCRTAGRYTISLPNLSCLYIRNKRKCEPSWQ